MTTNVKAQAAYEQAVKYAEECKANPLGQRMCPPQVEYAMRRVGGPEMLGQCDPQEFTQAFNDAPIVDADLDTESSGKILVRPLERKDGIR